MFRAGLDVGGCNFCNRNIGPSGYIDHAEQVWVVSGNSVHARFCEACMAEVLAEVRRQRRRGKKR